MLQQDSISPHPCFSIIEMSNYYSYIFHLIFLFPPHILNGSFFEFTILQGPCFLEQDLPLQLLSFVCGESVSILPFCSAGGAASKLLSVEPREVSLCFEMAEGVLLVLITKLLRSEGFSFQQFLEDSKLKHRSRSKRFSLQKWYELPRGLCLESEGIGAWMGDSF